LGAGTTVILGPFCAEDKRVAVRRRRIIRKVKVTEPI